MNNPIVHEVTFLFLIIQNQNKTAKIKPCAFCNFIIETKLRKTPALDQIKGRIMKT